MTEAMTEYKTWEELSPLEKAQQIYSDLYKDAYGVRPRNWQHINKLTLEQLNAELDFLETVIVQEIALDKAREERAAARFEAEIQANLERGATDRQHAIRWIAQANAVDVDDEAFLEYTMGLKMGYLKLNP